MNKHIFFLIWIVLLAVLGNLFFSSMDTKKIHIENALPMEFGNYKGKDLPLKQYVYDILGSHNVISREYQGGDFKAEISIVASFADRLVIHPPEVCMHGSGAGIGEKGTIRLCGINFIHMPVRYGEQMKYDVYYFYGIGDKTYDSYYRFQVDSFLHRILRKKDVSYLFRIIVMDNDKSKLEQFVCSVKENLDIGKAF